MKKITILLIAITACFHVTGCQSNRAKYATEIQKFRNANIPIIVHSVKTGRPNSVGGVDVLVSFTNASDKTFKYVDVTVTPFNRVGDKVRSSVGGYSTRTLRYTGPLYPGNASPRGTGWGNVWYNSMIDKARLEKVNVTYMDNTEEEYAGSKVVLYGKNL